MTIAARKKTTGLKPASDAKRCFQPILFYDWCKGCGLCIAFCPKHVYEPDEQGRPVVKRAADCTGCRFCELHCPDFAITIAGCPNREEAQR